ncbi:MAG: AAA family ATPase [Myxococcota bacterium]|nr:AAA family ATPase [Myxococcota bacterium]
MSLFDWRQAQIQEKEAPLAARMRPRTVDEFFGQEQILGHGRLLRRAIEADQLSSIIFYGPPGTGKTTLARIIANTTKAHFVALNAVLSGIKDIRSAIDDAKDKRGMHGRKSILFVDEVHRFNKAQQDALLPWVENGTVVLIGATTENPYFEVNKALVSRSRIFQLQALTDPDLDKIFIAACEDKDRGYGNLALNVEQQAREHLVTVANGDARALLNALELAVETTPSDEAGVKVISLEVAEESIQKRAVLYDKEGDAHFDTISAFIKSCRGSDPDAALYWLAKMIYAGEEPRFILRRLIILASEDVGLAHPDALTQVIACADAFDRVGMPEGRFHLAQATLIIANAPKSNSIMGFFDALQAVRDLKDGEVPLHLKDGSRDAKGMGHGEGYLYPHAFRDHWVEQQYLPTSLKGKIFYQPTEQGFEATIHADVTRRREAQLAALEESNGYSHPMNLTFSPVDPNMDQWLKRATANTSKKLEEARKRVFELADLRRHHVVLDLCAQSGLLTWEAVRQVPEGCVYSHVQPGEKTLRDRSYSLPELNRPKVIESTFEQVFSHIESTQKFDAIIGRRILTRNETNHFDFQVFVDRLQPNGKLVFQEPVQWKNQRLYDLVKHDGLTDTLSEEWKDAEERIYQDLSQQSTLENLESLAQIAGLSAGLEFIQDEVEILVTRNILKRWWDGDGQRKSYRQYLEARISSEGVQEIWRWTQKNWLNRRFAWKSTSAYFVATCICAES